MMTYYHMENGRLVTYTFTVGKPHSGEIFLGPKPLEITLSADSDPSKWKLIDPPKP